MLRAADVVEPQQHRGDVARLAHRNNPARDVLIRRSGPLLERVANEVFVEGTLGVGEKDPSVLVERLLELVGVAVVEAVDVKLNNSDDLIIIGRGGGHCDAPSVRVIPQARYGAARRSATIPRIMSI